MDRWKYFDITHRYHTVMNPMSEQKVDELIDYLNLSPGAMVLDVGCGKGEFLIRLTKKLRINGVGVDLSPFFIKEAEYRTKNLQTESVIQYFEEDGKAYVDNETQRFDLTVCMGASWIFGNYEGTLQALSNVTKPNGLIISGEPFWIKEGSQWYLDISEIKSSDYLTHSENIEMGEKLGLRPVYSMVSNLDDWDRYEHLQWLGADNHVLNNPDDPDNNELLSKLSKYRTAYIREGRDVFGWALYIFRKIE